MEFKKKNKKDEGVACCIKRLNRKRIKKFEKILFKWNSDSE